MALTTGALLAGSGAGMMAPIGFGLAASAATLAGGLLALGLANRLALMLAISAGVVLGVALFDLIPEALVFVGRGEARWTMLAWVAAGFGSYMLFDRLLGVGGADKWRAHLAPATLTLHSFIDGLGIGIAFQVSPQIGGLVAFAVLTHDLADGVNIVSLCLAAERHRAARAWLIANGLAPLLGVLTGVVVRLPGAVLASMMAMLAGLFLHIGAVELWPRSRRLAPRPSTTLAAVAGMATVLAIAVVGR